MADISKIKALNGTTYDIKDATARQNVSGKADKVTTATNGNFAALDANGNLKDSGHRHDDYLTSHQDISGKADKVHGSGINGNFAALDANGNLTDSGHKHSDYLTSTDVSGKADKVTGATSGNFASLDANGNLTDSGHKHGNYLTAHRPISVINTSINNNNLNFASGTYTGVGSSTSSGTTTVKINLSTSSLIGFNAYDTTKKYVVGDVVLYNSIMYRCTTATPSGGETWNSAHWAQFKLATDHYAIDDLRKDIAIVEKTSIAQHDISVGEYVIYYGELCRATANIASGDAIGIGTNLTSVMSKGGLNDLRSSGVEKIGEIRIWTSATAPSKWKICNGEIISRETYSDLFAVIGTTYGGGDGSTNFAIPDFRGRFAVGAGQSTAVGNTAHTLGQTDGEEKHVLSAAELASHGHSATASATASTSGKYKKNAQSGSNTNRVDSGGSSSTSAPYTTTVSVSVTVNAYGSNSAHNTMPPYTGVNYIIYTGVE